MFWPHMDKLKTHSLTIFDIVSKDLRLILSIFAATNMCTRVFLKVCQKNLQPKSSKRNQRHFEQSKIQNLKKNQDTFMYKNFKHANEVIRGYISMDFRIVCESPLLVIFGWYHIVTVSPSSASEKPKFLSDFQVHLGN